MTADTDQLARPSFLARLSGLFTRERDAVPITPSCESVPVSAGVKIAWQEQPFSLSFGNVALEVHPDIPISGKFADASREWIIHAGEAFYESVPRYLRISPGDTVTLGREDPVQTEIFGYGNSVAGRHLRITSRRGHLTILLLEPERPASICTIEDKPPMWSVRRENLLRLPQVLGHPIELLGEDEALAMIGEVNAIIEHEVYRELDDDGNPGGIIQFPDDKTVLILGDIHTIADNLLSALSQGGTLGALERNEACLVLLGDLVHSEDSDELEDMDSSMFMLDLFCLLKRRFPGNIFYIRGNHDSFSPDVGKAGVPQGILMRKELKKHRGKQYLAEVETLFERLALVVAGNEFAACHGGPVRARITRSTLVNAARYPGVQHELVWNRVRSDTRLGGYGKGSVKRFRAMMNISKHSPLIVGHTPQSTTGTLWPDVCGITGHHIIYSARTNRVASSVSWNGHTVLQEFTPDPALSVFDELAPADPEPVAASDPAEA